MKKEEVYQLIELFGLEVDYDQWDVPEKEWIRVKSKDFPAEFGAWPEGKGRKTNVLILYKEDGRETIIDELRMSLINMGKNLRSKEIRNFLII
jgi:hypothetical protein